MAIVRTYLCGACSCRFDKLHFDRSEPAPECPGCQALNARQAPSGFAIGGNASKAGDIAQNILEKDYGMTNIKDNQREGDISMPSVAPALQPVVQNFWKPTGDVMARARQSAQVATTEGRNPMTMIQRAAKARGTTRAQVLCKPVNSVR